MDNSVKDPFFDFALSFFPSGPQQILWANAFRHLMINNDAAAAVQPALHSSVFPLQCPPFILPASHHFFTSPTFRCSEPSSSLCHSFPPPTPHLASTCSKESEIFEFAANIKKRRLHLGITQV